MGKPAPVIPYHTKYKNYKRKEEKQCITNSEKETSNVGKYVKWTAKLVSNES
jgi:hypothetical protein